MIELRSLGSESYSTVVKTLSSVKVWSHVEAWVSAWQCVLAQEKHPEGDTPLNFTL